MSRLARMENSDAQAALTGQYGLNAKPLYMLGFF